MTRRPFGSVRSTRGASWNGRSGPTAGRSVCAAALVAASATAITVRLKPDTTYFSVAPESAFEVLEERGAEVHFRLLQLVLGDAVLLAGVDHLVDDLQDVRACEIGTVVDAERVEHRAVVVEIVAEPVVEPARDVRCNLVL